MTYSFFNPNLSTKRFQILDLNILKFKPEKRSTRKQSLPFVLHHIFYDYNEKMVWCDGKCSLPKRFGVGSHFYNQPL